MRTNPVRGFILTLLLFITGRVRFDREAIGKLIKTTDGKEFRVFRRVEIKSRKNSSPKACFIVRFRPMGMTTRQNDIFSLFPMMIFMGFKGFASKYWCNDPATGMCQGVYEWQTSEDATNYSKSIAIRFMTKRSEPGTVSFKILKNVESNYSIINPLDIPV